MNTANKNMALFLKCKTLPNQMSRRLMESLISIFDSENLFIVESYNILHRDSSETFAQLKSNPKTIQTYIENKQEFLDFIEHVANAHGFSSGSDYVLNVLALQQKPSDPEISHFIVRDALYNPKNTATGAELNAIIAIYQQALRKLAANYHNYELRKFTSRDFDLFLNSLSSQTTPDMAKAVILHIGGEQQFINSCMAHQEAESINVMGLFTDEDDAAIFYNDNFELCQEFVEQGAISNRKPSDVARIITSSLYKDYALYINDSLATTA